MKCTCGRLDTCHSQQLSSSRTFVVSHIEIHHGISGPLGTHPTNELKKRLASQILSNVRTNFLKQSYFGAGSGCKETLFLHANLQPHTFPSSFMWVIFIGNKCCQPPTPKRKPRLVLHSGHLSSDKTIAHT